MFATDRYETHPGDVSQFCNVTRGKPSWVFKILDDSKGLASQCALEAQLLRTEEDISDDALLVVQATRYCSQGTFDYSPQCGGKLEGDRDTPFSTIDRDFRNMLKVAREAKHFFTESKLREKVGAFVTDDFVPKSLHSEVCTCAGAAEFYVLLKQVLTNWISLLSRSLKIFILELKVENLIHPSSFDHPTELVSRFAWIPSNFHISVDGLDVHIEGYINGLRPRERYPRLYRLLEKVFLVVFAQLERTIEWEYSYDKSASGKSSPRSSLALLASQSQAKQAQEAEEENDIQQETEQRNHDLDYALKFHAFENAAASVLDYYRNKRLKVI
ncbi:hypothetical protein CCMSSC00406_0002584 [Pleurotus cornucopiae]|uniref:Uncharacterized protein n=1 Tax=Pleurotus cornucopiae TaxID=5321 RepID=A0ACB7IT71_PLECO|nr:hypothetical protein CCMSSC00406_0002584 [Pleurotus cornucopiae]